MKDISPHLCILFILNLVGGSAQSKETTHYFILLTSVGCVIVGTNQKRFYKKVSAASVYISARTRVFVLRYHVSRVLLDLPHLVNDNLTYSNILLSDHVRCWVVFIYVTTDLRCYVFMATVIR